MVSHLSLSFFSMKWKAAILIGFILLLFNGSIPIIVYWDLQHKFEFSRQQIHQHYHHELVGKLTSSSQQLQVLAELSLIPESSSSNEIIDNLHKHKDALSLNRHITQAHLYNRSVKEIGGWGETTPAEVLKSIPRVYEQERVITLINCDLGCQQYNLIPVLIDGETKNALLLAHDLSSILLNFTSNYQANVAVLSNYSPSNSRQEHLLPNWSMTVNALTDFEENIRFLNAFSKRYTIEALLETDRIFRPDDLPVEFSVINLEAMNDIVLVIIDDISAHQKDITSTTLHSLALSLINFIVVGIGLFVYLSQPLSRLSTVSRALPLLAQQRYEEARTLIKAHKRSKYYDELDQLEVSTSDLSSQLENLHNSVTVHTKELKQERDFIKNLIDSAQLIIITLNDQGKITSFNDFAESITGYRENQKIQTNFKQLFSQAQWPDLDANLTKLKHNAASSFQQESTLVDREGRVHSISWLYSSLTHPTDNSSVLAVGVDITAKKENERKIIWLADHDALTSLYNRRKFNLEFENILNHAKRFNHQGMLLFLDLDQFKDINDSCGHEAGDQVLKQTAQTLQSITRHVDVLARLGGDEFAIILPETDIQGAIILAEKIAKKLADLNIRFNNTQYKISTSIGIINFPLAGLSVGELISNADLAMYEAKRRGKNTWYQFTLDSESRQQLETRVLWKHRIEDALENDRFIFYYQPIMDIRTRTVSHYEALIRMVTEDGTVHPPGTFIQIAEQTGLIHQIDHLVLQRGIHKQAELDAQGNNTSLSLNLSGYAVDDKQLLPILKKLLEQTQANPEHLFFELTETAAVADIEQAKELMDHLKQSGCHFSLDDFGTGFASFRYMRELPVDIVKIDGSFISNLVNSPDDQLFVKALIDVAKGMGKKTIAEFVENAETLALLHAFGVDYAQGYYIGKPKPEFLNAPPRLK